jgi:hypothetical protein
MRKSKHKLIRRKAGWVAVQVLNRTRRPYVITAPQNLPQALSGNRAFFFDSACAIVGACGGFASRRSSAQAALGQQVKSENRTRIMNLLRPLDSGCARKRATESCESRNRDHY